MSKSKFSGAPSAPYPSRTAAQAGAPPVNRNAAGNPVADGFPMLPVQAKPPARATVKGLQGYSSKPNNDGGTTYTRDMNKSFGGANY